jgi:histidinol-phosphate phosphatase family protein
MKNSYSLIVIDRDGVINKKSRKHTYINSWNKFEFLPRVKEALKLLNLSYLRIVVITNQPGISKGLFSFEDLESIHKKMCKEINLSGGRIDKIYFCPHKEEDRCDCRKPKPKMILDAIKNFNLSPEKTIYLGDFFKDYETAKNAGVKFIFINSKSDEQEETMEEFNKHNISPISFPSLFKATKFLIS